MAAARFRILIEQANIESHIWVEPWERLGVADRLTSIGHQLLIKLPAECGRVRRTALLAHSTVGDVSPSSTEFNPAGPYSLNPFVRVQEQARDPGLVLGKEAVQTQGCFRPPIRSAGIGWDLCRAISALPLCRLASPPPLQSDSVERRCDTEKQRIFPAGAVPESGTRVGT